MSRVLELYPPAILPFTGVTSVSFRAWQRHFTAYLEQDINSPHFLPDGLYETWQARGKNRARIAELHVDDPERFFLMDRLTAVLEGRQRWPNDPRMDQYNQAHLDRDLAALLQARNAQLSKFITLITVLCPALTLSPITWISSALPSPGLSPTWSNTTIFRSQALTFCLSATLALTRRILMRTFIWSFMLLSRIASANRGNSSSSAIMSL